VALAVLLGCAVGTGNDAAAGPAAANERFVVDTTVFERASVSEPDFGGQSATYSQALAQRAVVAPGEIAGLGATETLPYNADLCMGEDGAGEPHLVTGELRHGERVAVQVHRNEADEWTGTAAVENSRIVALPDYVIEKNGRSYVLQLPDIHTYHERFELPPSPTGHWVLLTPEKASFPSQTIVIDVSPYAPTTLGGLDWGRGRSQSPGPAELGYYDLHLPPCTLHGPGR